MSGAYQCNRSEMAAAYQGSVADDVLNAYIAAGCVVFAPWTVPPAESETTPPTAELTVDESQLFVPGNETRLAAVAHAIARHPCAVHVDALVYTKGLRPLAEQVAVHLGGMRIVHTKYREGSDVPVFADDGRERAKQTQIPMILVGATATSNSVHAHHTLLRETQTKRGPVHVIAGLARDSGTDTSGRGELAYGALSHLSLLTTRLGLWVRTGYWAEDGRVERP